MKTASRHREVSGRAMAGHSASRVPNGLRSSRPRETGPREQKDGYGRRGRAARRCQS